MVNLLIEQYKETGKIASVSRAELFNRMLNINEANADDVEKKKVMTAFSIFKFIGMYEREAEQGKFIANNQTLTPLSIEHVSCASRMSVVNIQRVTSLTGKETWF